MNVAIYVRVSTQEQVQEGYSVEVQKERLRDYCKARNWNLIAEILPYEVF
jgi:site-specific DNA recombinase